MYLESPATTTASSTPAADWFVTASEVFKLYAIPFLWQVLGAIGIWIVGGILIRFACRMVGTAMTARNLDRTLTSYVTSALSILLRVVLIAGVLGMFGVESTSFAALLAAAGVAIGMAWAGLLANFAAGVFLVLLRPFKVGDVITAAGVSGLVTEIGLFATTLDTRDNVRIFVGNNKLFGDNIINHSHNPYVRTELIAQVANGVDPFAIVARLTPLIAQIPHVMSDPAPEVGVREFNAAGTVIYIRPYVLGGGAEVEAVKGAGYRAIAEATAGLPVPAPYQVLLQQPQR
jgi:small conductance mechanosensitive channel